MTTLNFTENQTFQLPFSQLTKEDLEKHVNFSVHNTKQGSLAYFIVGNDNNLLEHMQFFTDIAKNNDLNVIRIKGTDSANLTEEKLKNIDLNKYLIILEDVDKVASLSDKMFFVISNYLLKPKLKHVFFLQNENTAHNVDQFFINRTFYAYLESNSLEENTKYEKIAHDNLNNAKDSTKSQKNIKLK